MRRPPWPPLFALAVELLVGGCRAQLGSVAGVLGSETYAPAMVLATGARGEDCGAAVLFVPLRRANLADAVARAIASVPEATLLIDADVETRSMVTGVYNRRCVVVRGSAAKLVSSVVLPMPMEHGHHGGAP